MNRQPLDNGTWFDTHKAEKFEEDTFWDGNNRCSQATGSQWNHEALYRTASGGWVLNAWSQWAGSRETWTLIDPDTACSWLIAQNEDTAAEEYFPELFAKKEV
jgi:hypothetical protein